MSAFDHPGQHRHDAHEQLLARLQRLGIENAAPAKDVENRAAFPRRSARDLQEVAPVGRRYRLYAYPAKSRLTRIYDFDWVDTG